MKSTFLADRGVTQWRHHTWETAMKIGVIGSGDVGQVLASGFLKHGYEVVIGTRDPVKLAT